MEIKSNEKVKENGAYEKTTIIKTTKKDGWNDADVVIADAGKPLRRLFKGNAKSFHYTTNNPKVTKPIVIIYSLCLIIIGILLLIISHVKHNNKLILGGIIILITAISFLISSLNDIRKIEKKNKKNGK